MFLGYTGWVLVTLEGLDNFILGYIMAINPYLPNYTFLVKLHGLAEAPVAHWLGPDHHGEV